MRGRLFVGLKREVRKTPCPRCGEKVKVDRCGRDPRGRQNWRCRACKKRYCMALKKTPTVAEQQEFVRHNLLAAPPLIRWMRAALAPPPPPGRRAEALAIMTLRRLYEADPLRYLERLSKMEMDLLRTSASIADGIPQQEDRPKKPAPVVPMVPMDVDSLLQELTPKGGHAVPGETLPEGPP